MIWKLLIETGAMKQIKSTVITTVGKYDITSCKWRKIKIQNAINKKTNK